MRHIGLDLLRLVAILLVIGRHLDLPDGTGGILRLWQTGGWIGVDLFFVLSGYLVSSLLLRELQESGTLDVRRFLVRRAWRILPAFWLCIAASLLVQVSLGTPPPLRKLAGEALFLQNYLGGIWPHTWSLAVEAHFYLALPVVLAWLCRERHRGIPRFGLDRLPQLVLWTASGCLLLRVVSALMFPRFHAFVALFGTHIRADSLMFGVWLAWMAQFRGLHERVRRLPRGLLPLAGVLLLAPAFLFPLEEYRWVSVWGVNLFALGSGCLLLATLARPVPQNRITSSLAGLGTASYTIYLWHFPVLRWCCPAVASSDSDGSLLYYVAMAVVGSCAAGWLMHEVMERPVQSLRNRLVPSRAITPDAASSNATPADLPPSATTVEPMRSAA